MRRSQSGRRNSNRCEEAGFDEVREKGLFGRTAAKLLPDRKIMFTGP